MHTLVMKFGGTSVGSVGALQHVVDIVKEARQQTDRLAVIVSAMSGVTDTLQAGILGAANGDPVGHRTVGRALIEKYKTVRDMVEPSYHAFYDEAIELVEDYVKLCDSVYVLGEATPRALDYAMGLGERMSVRLITMVLLAAGIRARVVDTTNVIVTDDGYQNAAPDLDATYKRVQSMIVPILDEPAVAVITGFVGATPTGISTTLGRGGSDYSAAIIGACLECDELWIWTDVDGVMSADPRIVPSARTIDMLTYREVGELAYYGAKVLHPKTIRPVLELGIPIRVKNTFNAPHPGTLILSQPGENTNHRVVKAVTAIKGLAMITIEGKGMLGVPGIAARAFGAVAQTGTSILLISQASSEQSICFVIHSSNAHKVSRALNAEFSHEIERRDIDHIGLTDNMTIVTVVGVGMRGTPGVASQVFTAAADAGVNIIAIAQGSSECSISFTVATADTDAVVRGIHQLTTA